MNEATLLDMIVPYLTLSALEIVLGVDNIIFLTILTNKLPKSQQEYARNVGLFLAMFTRLLLLFSITWLMQFNNTLFTAFANAISGRDLVLILGGLFLIFKSTLEMHESVEGQEIAKTMSQQKSVFISIVIQIAIIDIVFSLDSVITAVGMVQHIPVMVAAIVTAMCFMLLAAKHVANFVDNHPTIKILALAFLVLIGFALIADGLDIHIPKGYMYFAMLFSLSVETINIRMRRKEVISRND